MIYYFSLFLLYYAQSTKHKAQSTKHLLFGLLISGVVALSGCDKEKALVGAEPPAKPQSYDFASMKVSELPQAWPSFVRDVRKGKIIDPVGQYVRDGEYFQVP